jgi:Leucine-rich repeat (LRR) protein
MCTFVDRVDVDHNHVVSLSPLWSLSRLSQLSAAHNRIRALDGVQRIANTLKQINVSHNELRSVDALSVCVELRVLIANNNQLSALPASLPLKLATLVVSHNQLQALDGVEKCTQLTKLSASHNALTRLPAGLTQLTRLSELRVNHNLLTDLPGTDTADGPTAFGRALARIKLIDLGNNRFMDVGVILDALKPMHFLRNVRRTARACRSAAFSACNGSAAHCAYPTPCVYACFNVCVNV